MSDQTPGPDFSPPEHELGAEGIPPTGRSEGSVEIPPPSEIPPMYPREAPRHDAIPPMSPPQEFASNYPRSGAFMMGFIRPPGVYWDTLSASWTMITANLSTYLLSGLIMWAMLAAIYAIFFIFFFGAIMAGSLASPSGNQAMTSFAMVIPQAILQFCIVFLQFCMISIGVKLAQGYPAEVSDFFTPFKRFGSTALASLLVVTPMIFINLLSALLQVATRSNVGLMLSISVVMLLLMIPFYIGGYGPMLLSGVSAIFTGKSPIDTAKTLYGRLGWSALMFGLLVMVFGVISGVGAIACGFGILFTYPILTNSIALHYIYNFPEDQPKRQVA